MSASNCSVIEDHGQPADCPLAVCSALMMYQQEIERHRETEARLQEVLLREREHLREQNRQLLHNDILTKESEHRFLNGLQLISSVLAMESRDSKSPEAAMLLTRAAKRVATLARVHRHLHTLDNMESVEFRQFLEKLCVDLTDIASVDGAQRWLQVDGYELHVTRAKATPLAYIASELITNSLKYANGKIMVSVKTLPNGEAVLSVADDGPGLSDTRGSATPGGLGMKIISSLVNHIRGKITYARGAEGQGTKVSVLFSPADSAY